MILAIALSASAYALTPDDATPEFCNGVTQEIARVKEEISVADGRLQKDWLARQLKALKAKNDLCLSAGITD